MSDLELNKAKQQDQILSWLIDARPLDIYSLVAKS